MKKILYSIFVVATALSFASCKGFLDTESPSKLIPEVVYKNPDMAEKGVLGIYMLFNQDRMYGQTLSINLNNGSDTDIQKYSGTPASNEARAMGNYLDTPSNMSGVNQKVWDYLFISLGYANTAIAGIENSPTLSLGTNAQKLKMKSLLAEAKVLRAMIITELGRIFGDIPLNMTAVADPQAPRTDLMVVYQTLIEDLDGVAQDLAWIPTSGDKFERVGRGYAHALRARIALYRAGFYFTRQNTWVRGSEPEKYYQIAKDECEAIMENPTHQLNTSFKNVFERQCRLESDPETLFQVSGGAPGRVGEIGYLTGIPFNTGGTKYGCTLRGTDPQTWTSAAFLYSFDKNDIRRDLSVAYYKWDNTSTQVIETKPRDFYIAKWSNKYMNPSFWTLKQDSGANKTTTGVGFVLMRYADVLLMFAEAENALNGATTEAKNALYRVRNRAFGGALSQADFDTYLASKGDFQSAIEDERMWELAGEGVRKYDLIRWGKLAEKIALMKAQTFKIVIDKVNPFDNNAALPTTLYFKRLAADQYGDAQIDFSSIGLYAQPTNTTGYEAVTNWLGGVEADIVDFRVQLQESASGLVSSETSGATFSSTILNNGRPYHPLSSATVIDANGAYSNLYGY